MFFKKGLQFQSCCECFLENKSVKQLVLHQSKVQHFLLIQDRLILETDLQQNS